MDGKPFCPLIELLHARVNTLGDKIIYDRITTPVAPFTYIV